MDWNEDFIGGLYRLSEMLEELYDQHRGMHIEFCKFLGADRQMRDQASKINTILAPPISEELH